MQSGSQFHKTKFKFAGNTEEQYSIGIGEDKVIRLMHNTSRTTLPFPAGICFKYLSSRLQERGIAVTAANDLFHHLRVVVPTKWIVPRISFDIKILGKSENSDVYIIHRRLFPIKVGPVEEFVKKQLEVLVKAIGPEA